MTLIEQLRERRNALKAELDALAGAVETRDNKTFSDEENVKIDTNVSEIRKLDERLVELDKVADTETRAAQARVVNGETDRPVGGGQVTDPPVYVKGNGNGNSYFRDLGRAATEGGEARDAIGRLVRNSRAAQSEKRALGNTNGTGGSGGEFAPPLWLEDEWIGLLRPGRVLADLYASRPVPAGVTSVSIPKLLTGTAVALQSTQNTTLATTDPTTSFVTTGFATIGGRNVWSQQLMDQAAVPIDDIIAADLAAAYNQYFAQQLYIGAGTGSGTNAVLNGLNAATAGTSTTLTGTDVPSLYSALGSTLSAFITKRLAQPEVIVMHPRRWTWLVSRLDSSNRPLSAPANVAVNPITVLDSTPGNVAGRAGSLLGIPVVTDPSVPTNTGTGTNQDTIYMLKASDFILFESTPQAEAFRSPYAESLGILFRLYNYVGAMLNRHSESIAVISGVGLVPPTF